ncbi:ISL3 family transposase [Dactylosporangium sp. NBC_01737]|uniref:ISL3 family transposase n=1 Tax=Dactylosporangium sp. NBC_01737 TaxID=2975959 RepID=UPI003FA35EB8
MRQATGRCPACGIPASRVHDRYERQIADTAVAGQRVLIRLQVRRFICDVAACTRRTFVEQADGLTFRYGRVTRHLHETLQVIAAALAGRPGARLAARTAIATSRSTLLRVLRAIPLPTLTAGPRVLGVDEFAIRRGATYATLLLDMETHRPIDVFDGRTADSFAAWLRAHPGVETICRDRGGNYAEGARSGAPGAVQVADRFHLWANLGEAVEKTVIAHRSCLPEPVPTDEETQTAPALVMPDQGRDGDGDERRLTVRKRERYAAVQALMIAGNSLNSISRQTGLCFRTVQCYAQADSLDELLATAERSSTLDRFKQYLLTRWNDGCTDVGRLHHELQGMGWRGSARTVQRYAHQLRGLTSAPAPGPVTPKPRKVAKWLMTNPANLTAGDQVRLKAVIARCPELEATRRHVAEFAFMMRELRGDQLPNWMAAVAADELPALHSFVKGLNRDLDAVKNGLTLTWSSGACEGAVNRVKALKRSMFGRANLDLLRHRILLPN